ncbi:hypothetical protein HFN80_02540 [Rhizobium laguerreae]|uniref:hypothetical protein n=1 Tax=Rhizobium laguerreae TaxID=1076926 RepID=UPI001C91A29E|nr:hypothetical protein [Rhizobium laguerreae]MBY3462898.1 hypothetical protein [Rhizobium laguerreae]
MDSPVAMISCSRAEAKFRLDLGKAKIKSDKFFKHPLTGPSQNWPLHTAAARENNKVESAICMGDARRVASAEDLPA